MIIDRMVKAVDKLALASEQRNWVYGRLGVLNGSEYVFDVPAQPGYVYVRLGFDGDQGKTTARNLGVSNTPDLPIKMRRENGKLVIRAVDQDGAGWWNLPDDPDIPTGEGAPSPHSLDGPHHVGTISNAQGPQFLLANGGRTLTGHLGVDPGVMIDGVDLSAFKSAYDVHIGNPDAHHARATAGNSGVLVTGQAVSLVLASNSGLELSSGVRVKISDGIGRDANGVFLRRAADSGLAINVSGEATLGTPSNVTANSANSVTGVSHTHFADSASDVGTTPPGVNKLLHATSGGGLILANLGVKGRVDITNGGDLYVSGSIGGASGVLVTMGDRVGFGRVPDPQFMVDVNGPLRADFLIGKHAIQLDGVLLLSHWDGGEPYANNMTAEENGHKGQIGTLVGGAIFRPGKFYKALQAAPSGVNFCTNPSFEVNTAGWTFINGGTWGRVTTDAYVGTACLRAIVPNSSSAGQIGISGLTPGDVYVVSAWVKRETPTGTAGFYVCDFSYANSSVSNNIPEGGWQRAVATYVVPANGQLRVVLRGDAGTMYYDAIQIETANLTPYLDGSLGAGPGLVTNGHSWSGTPHASTSSRSDGRLDYAVAGNLLPERGTIMAWVWVDSNNSTSTLPILEAGDAWPRFALYMTGGTVPTFLIGNASGFNQAQGPSSGGVGRWVHVAVTWNIYTKQMVAYTNGIAGTPTTITFDGAPSLASTIRVGRITTLSDRHFNGYIDDLVILDRVSPPNEVRAVYESNAPVFAESSVFVFRATPMGLVWADERGLWMRDADGNPVLGAYGGEAATHQWGGVELEKGDIIFGRRGLNNGGWLLFDRDGVSSKPFMSLGYADKETFAFDANGARTSGWLNIGTSGGIYQGTGSPTGSHGTGLKIWNESGIGKIAGFNANQEQWSADTDGRLKAGQGFVTLDRTGAWLSTVTNSNITPTPGLNSLGWRSSGNVIAHLSGQLVGAASASALVVEARGVGALPNAIMDIRASNSGGSGPRMLMTSNNGRTAFFSTELFMDAPTIWSSTYDTHRFGVGTASPSSKFHVHGAAAVDGGITISSSSGTATDRLAMYPAGNLSTFFKILPSGSSALQIRDHADNVIAIFHGGDRSVSIGTGTINAKLAVEADANWPGVQSTLMSGSISTHFLGRRSRGSQSSPTQVLNNDVITSFGGIGYTSSGWPTTTNVEIVFGASENQLSSFRGSHIKMYATPTGSASKVLVADLGGDNQVYFPGIQALTTASAPNVNIDSNGQLRRSTFTVAPSSRRYKDNIEPLDLPDDFFDKINPVTFTYKPELNIHVEEELQIGLIAEDVHDAGGEIFVKYKDGKPDALKYDKLVMALIAGIKSLQNRVEDLERRLN